MPNLERLPDEAMSLMDSIEEDPYDLSIFIDQVRFACVDVRHRTLSQLKLVRS